MRTAFYITVATIGLFIASGATAAGTWKYGLTVSSIVTYTNGTTLLIMEASDPACGSSGNQFTLLAGLNGQTADGVKMTLANALAAYSLGKTVNVYVDTAISGCPITLLQLNP